MSSKKLQIYSVQFAQGVLEGFLKKRGRATEFYANLNEIPLERFHEILRDSVRFNQKRWNLFKKAIKAVGLANNVAEDDAGATQTPIRVTKVDRAPAGSRKPRISEKDTELPF